MKQIAILTSVHYAFDTRIFYRISQSLVKHGYDVTLIAPMDETNTFIKNKINILPVQKPKNRLSRILKTTWQVYKKALQVDADIYHFHDPELIFVGYLLKLRGKTVIYDIHENVSKQILNKEWVPLKRFASLTYRLIERLFISKFHLVLAEKSYEQLYLYHKNKITVQNFPNLDIIPDASEEKDKNSIVYLGGVSKERGIETTIQSLAKLKQAGQEFHFKCIGPINQQYQAKLEQLCEDTNIKENVSFLGRLNAEDAYKIVRQSQIGLAILHPIGNYLESYPTKVFEYMALRTPYITSNFALYSDLTNDTQAGLTTDPFDTDGLTEKLIFLLNDHNILTEMSENGRASVEEKYNWEQEEKKLIELYSKL
ncbi:hypothetical protein COK06_00025 [Bacillus cereus]|nr:hypothetical protein COI72_02390 [Bacillus cereus]PFQ00503.1 hypothetical protein COK06_00025 [Bacillus cereus]